MSGSPDIFAIPSIIPWLTLSISVKAILDKPVTVLRASAETGKAKSLIKSPFSFLFI